MHHLEWVVDVPRDGRRITGHSELRQWLTEVVLATRENRVETKPANNLQPYAKSPGIYASQSSAAWAGRRAVKYAAEVFGGTFDWFTRQEEHRYRLYVSYVPQKDGGEK